MTFVAKATFKPGFDFTEIVLTFEAGDANTAAYHAHVTLRQLGFEIAKAHYSLVVFAECRELN